MNQFVSMKSTLQNIAKSILKKKYESLFCYYYKIRWYLSEYMLSLVESCQNHCTDLTQIVQKASLYTHKFIAIIIKAATVYRLTSPFQGEGRMNDVITTKT